jgi:hypothetical protein
MVGIGEKLVRRERPPAVAPLWWEHLACLSQQKNPGAKISSPDPRLYFTQDANWDTMAVVGYDGTSGTWGVVQRYVYSPYGTITVLNADWSTPASPSSGARSRRVMGMFQRRRVMRIHSRMADRSRRSRMPRACHRARWTTLGILGQGKIRRCLTTATHRNGLARTGRPAIGTAHLGIRKPANGPVVIPRATDGGGEINI